MRIAGTLTLALGLAVGAQFGISNAGEMRTWTAESGGPTVEGEYIASRDGDVILRTEEGTVTVSLAQLSAPRRQGRSFGCPRNPFDRESRTG